MLEETIEELRAAHDELRTSFASPVPPSEPKTKTDTGAAVVTGVAAERLIELGEQLLRVPDGFVVNPKLARQLERRRASLTEGGIDWGYAEALAFGALLEEGIPIRLSGQDTERGTFSHRHAVLHDPRTGETFTPLQHLPDGGRVLRDLQLAPLRVCRARVRARLLDRRSRRARPLGGAVRRLRERRADRRRPVHRLRSLEVGADVPARAAAPARLRGQRSRALERPSRALSPARRAGQHPRRELLDVRAVLPPPAPAGSGRDRAAARGHDAEGPPAAARGNLVARRPLGRRVPTGARRRVGRPRDASRRLVLCSGKIYYDIEGHEARADARRRGRGEDRAALSVPARARLGARRVVPCRPRDRLGAGGAAEHGRLALDPAPPRRGGRSGENWSNASSTSAARGARARARATRRCTTTSRTGSCARRSASRPRRRTPRSGGRAASASRRRAARSGELPGAAGDAAPAGASARSCRR